MSRCIFFVFTLSLLMFSQIGLAELPPSIKKSDVQTELDQFKENPYAYMWSPPKKFMNGRRINGSDLTRGASILSKNFSSSLKEKIEKRRNAFLKSDSIPFANDLAENLVDNPGAMLTSLAAMDKYRSLAMPVSPWSDSYWPVYWGQTAARYEDIEKQNMANPAFTPQLLDWLSYFNYSSLGTSNGPDVIVKSGNSVAIDDLSPAEKYDLLLGDDHWTLSQRQWNVGKELYYPNEYIPEWVGLCHGWAAASINVLRPNQMIANLPTPSGIRVNFYPADVKALATLLWATDQKGTRFIGGRCNLRESELRAVGKIDPKTGRILDSRCNDTNPATWHLAVVNQILEAQKRGDSAQRSLAIDANYDAEIWNQPIYSYSYSYFNPANLQAASTVAEAKVPMSIFRATDPFAKFRKNPYAVSVAGIAMDLVFISETQPGHYLRDDESRDKRVTVRYLYDLELDAQDKIIGGEWYANLHPDFLWTPGKGVQAQSGFDDYLAQLLRRNGESEWDGYSIVPKSYIQNASKVSDEGTPIGAVVRKLIERAH